MGLTTEMRVGETAEGTRSQAVRSLMSIRELILEGVLPPGKRISELSVAGRTGISRTPIRAALQRLAEEGLVETIPSGGFAVSSFSQQDVFDAIEVRGVLEGMAARLAAERGSVARLGPLQDCLAELDRLVEQAVASEDGFSGYVAANARLHALIVDLAESAVLKRQIERAAFAMNWPPCSDRGRRPLASGSTTSDAAGWSSSSSCPSRRSRSSR